MLKLHSNSLQKCIRVVIIQIKILNIVKSKVTTDSESRFCRGELAKTVNAKA